MVFGTIFYTVFLGVVAIFCTLCRIPLNIGSYIIFTAGLDILLGFLFFREKKMPKLVWQKPDLYACILLVGFIIFLAVFRFGPSLKLVYTDVDAARYFQYGISIFRYDAVPLSQYLVSAVIALFIEICSPVLQTVSYYKAMILAHIVMQIISMLVFYVVTTEINPKKKYRWINIIVTLLFWCGFPLCYSSYGTFIHSVFGASFLMLLVYYTLRLQKETISFFRGIMGLVASGIGLVMCYPYFAIVAFFILIPEVVLWLRKNWKEISKWAKVAGAISVGIVVVFAVWTWGTKFDSSFDKLFAYVLKDGLSYKEPFRDFVFFIPVFVMYVFMLVKNKTESKILLRINISGTLFIGMWFILFMNEYLSPYYYYRMYYVLWILVWWMVADTARLMLELKQYLGVIAYATFYLIAVLTSVLDVNTKLQTVREDMYFEAESTSPLCPLYKFNANIVDSTRESIINEDEFGLYYYVINNLKKENVFAINSFYTAMQMQWYQGITGADENAWRSSYDIEEYELFTILEELDKYGIRYIMIEKTDEICMKYYDLLFSKFDVEYENEAGYIFVRDVNESWTKIAEQQESADGFYDLGSYVKNELASEDVPIICEWKKGTEALYYSMFAGIDDMGYADENPEKFIEKTYMLNNEGTNYIVILKDSEVYALNKKYFDNQQVVYETDAGMVLSHAGTGWMPSEQE